MINPYDQLLQQTEIFFPQLKNFYFADLENYQKINNNIDCSKYLLTNRLAFLEIIHGDVNLF